MSSSEDPPAVRLKPLQVPGFAKPIDLVDGRLTFGRAEDNDVCLPGDVFPSVSQHHARIDSRSDGLWIEDLGSRNGTLIDDEAIESTPLKPGDVFQLGAIGPRFVVVSSAPLSETMFVDAKQAGVRKGNVSKSTVEELVRHRSRHTLRTVLLFALLLVIALVYWGQQLSRRDAEGQARLTEELKQNREESGRELTQVQGLTHELQKAQEQRTLEQQEYESRLMKIEEEKQRIEDDRRTLQARFDQLEADEDASADQLATLRTALEATQQQLNDNEQRFALVDPVNLEQARLKDVRRVRSSIVQLEASFTIRNRDTGSRLHVANEHGGRIPNFEEMGEPWSVDSTGSGFCVSPDGWILTNAHVVSPPPDAGPMMLAGTDLPIEPVMEIKAVFSGDFTRHPVEVVTIANQGDDDLALVKIEPFDTMPYLEALDLDVPIPEPGSDVFLFGFPLGNFALQQGETVIASTFRGILSRVVDHYMQVDAGVHPGNSGGPVTDGRGQVVGIVFSVQALPDKSAVYTIGYAIPIAEAAKVWPPPENWGQ